MNWRHRQFFLALFYFILFSYWSKFHVNIITGVMTIFLCKRLTRNPESGNTTIWVLPNIWRLEKVRDTKFGTNVSNEMLLNPAKCQGYSVYRFWVIKGKLTGRKITPTHTPRLGLTWNKRYFSSFLKGFNWSKQEQIFWKVRVRL